MPDSPHVRQSLTTVANTPLPGHFPCLTIQLNATVHPSKRSCKVVGILRDPDTQQELMRRGYALGTVDEGLVEAGIILSSLIAELLYLGGITH